VIDSVLYLQHYSEGWTDGKFEEKHDYRDCIETPPRYAEESSTGLYDGWFWEYDEMRAKNFACLSVQGTTATIMDLVRDSPKLLNAAAWQLLNQLGSKILLNVPFVLRRHEAEFDCPDI
jgi:hypothetical protein